MEPLRFTLTTTVNDDDIIQQTLEGPNIPGIDDISVKLNTWVFDTREKGLRAGLIKLGWIPPCEIKSVAAGTGQKHPETCVIGRHQPGQYCFCCNRFIPVQQDQ